MLWFLQMGSRGHLAGTPRRGRCLSAAPERSCHGDQADRM